jgi:integrase
VKDVVLNEEALFVLGKGKDDKEPIHLHPHTKKALTLYIEQSERLTDEYLFASIRRQSDDGKLTERGLRYIVKAILNELDINRNVHGFRHYFTTHLIKAMPGELLKVSYFTRHSSLEMLKVYNDSIVASEDYAVYEQAFA